MLQKLARALRLSTREQYQFFYAAMNMEQCISVNRMHQEQILQGTLEELSSMRTPAMVHDNLYFILLANEAWLRIMGLDYSTYLELQPPASSACKFNYIHLLLHEKLSIKPLHASNRKIFLSEAIREFRVSSLPYCYTDRYRGLLKFLLTYPVFVEEWQNCINQNTNQEDIQYEGKCYHFQGTLKSTIYKQTVQASFGKLHYTIHMANSEDANVLFSQLAEKHGGQTYKFAEWDTKYDR